MIAKEWHDALWKFGAASGVVLLAVVVAPIPMPYAELSSAYATDGIAQPAASELWALYSAGSVFVLLPLAALLGASLISEELNRGTVFFLLSRPVSRTRLLLTKYAVCAGVLLMAAVLGAVLVVLVAGIRGYPVADMISLRGPAFPVALSWLGALFVLAISLTTSVFLRGTVYSLVAAVLVALLIFTFPGNVLNFFYFVGYEPSGDFRLHEVTQGFTPLMLLVDGGWFEGGSASVTGLVFWLVAAAAALAVALRVFRRRAY